MDLAEQRRRREYVRRALAHIDRQMEEIVRRINAFYQDRLDQDYEARKAAESYRGEVSSDHD
jgi:citrate lyase beta subunit